MSYVYEGQASVEGATTERYLTDIYYGYTTTTNPWAFVYDRHRGDTLGLCTVWNSRALDVLRGFRPSRPKAVWTYGV